MATNLDEHHNNEWMTFEFYIFGGKAFTAIVTGAKTTSKPWYIMVVVQYSLGRPYLSRQCFSLFHIPMAQTKFNMIYLSDLCV